MKKILKITLSLFLVCFLAVGALAAVNLLTADTIEQNRAGEIKKALESIIPGCEYIEITDPEKTAQFAATDAGSKTVIQQVYAAKKDGEDAGTVVVLSTKGYIDKIALRVGILPDGTIAGVVIGENSETPGLGANIAKESFYSQFKGKNGSISYDEIDFVTSATYSSKYVIDGVKAAAEAVKIYGGDAK